MRTLFCLVVLALLTAAQASAARRVTVQELSDTLASMHKDYKTDDEVADALKRLQLSQELTPADLRSLAVYVPGPLTTQQLEILRGLSAFEPPAPAEGPSTPAPDPAAQKTILDAAGKWVASTFDHDPPYKSTRIFDRYEDTLVNVNSSTAQQPDSPLTYAKSSSESRVEEVVISPDAEKVVVDRAKPKWGPNGLISEPTPIPSLAELLNQASASGSLAFLRWQNIDGKPAAVFSFAVDKKKSHYTVNYCCFPAEDLNGAQDQTVSTNQLGAVTSWRPFKKGVGYHGQLFIDPASGAILRTITSADFQPKDYVHLERVRIDYLAESVDGKPSIVRAYSVTLNELAPNGQAGIYGYAVRHMLLISTYGNFRSATAP